MLVNDPCVDRRQRLSMDEITQGEGRAPGLEQPQHL